MMFELRRLILKYRALLLTACGLGTAIGLIMAQRQKPRFVATAVIGIPGGPVAFAQEEQNVTHGPSPSFITEALTIKQDRTLNRVISELHLAENRAFLSTAGPEDNAPGEQDRPDEHALGVLRANLVIQVVNGANLLRISYESRDPKLAAQIVDRVVEDFQQDRYELRYKAAQEATAFMHPRLDTLAQQVRQEQVDLLNLQRRLDHPGFNPRRNPFDKEVDTLSSSVIEARLATLVSRIKLSLLQTGVDAMPSMPIPPASNANQLPQSSLVADEQPASLGDSTSLRLALAEAQQKAATLSATLGPSHPDLMAVEADARALQASLEAERRALVAASSTAADLAALRERALASELQRREQKAVRTQPIASQYDDEQRDYLFSRALYLRFLWRLRITSIQKAFDSADVSIIDRASVHRSEALRSRWSFIEEYLFFSLILAALTILRLELHFGTAMKRIDEFEDYTGLRVLTTVPQTGQIQVDRLAGMHTDNSRPLLEDGSQAPYIQSIFDLRARLEHHFRGSPGGHTILFTSAVPSEGKTTISSSVAGLMARPGRRVLLIDADLRRPAVQRALRLPGRLGLSSVLNGKCTLAEAVQHVPGAPCLDVLGSGPIPPISSELAGSLSMQRLLLQAAAAYDFVIVDSPPILAASDSLLIAPMVDAVVWVVKDLKAGRFALARARSLLENAGAPAIGLVVNAVNTPHRELSPDPSKWPQRLLNRFRRA